ncbi:MAG: hypothetical protein ACE5HK_04990, partial [Candidatus Methylomirabilales bacterium]
MRHDRNLPNVTSQAARSRASSWSCSGTVWVAVSGLVGDKKFDADPDFAHARPPPFACYSNASS